VKKIFGGEAKHNPWDFTKISMQINYLISVYRG